MYDICNIVEILVKYISLRVYNNPHGKREKRTQTTKHFQTSMVYLQEVLS